MLLAVRVAYDGSAFSGSQRQPDVRTVEGDLLRALAAIGAGAEGFRTASRTDAGVSAVGNVFVVETDFRREELCSALNAHLADAWCHATSPAPPGLDPRRAARARAYRYFLPAAGLDPARFREALGAFVGEHDFSAFARVESHRSPRRAVTRATVAAESGFLVVDVEGPSFLWNQVRRMVGAASAVARGEAEPAAIAEALRSGKGPDLGLAPPEGLVLLDVDVPLPWETDPVAADRAARALSERLVSVEREARLLATLVDAFESASRTG